MSKAELIITSVVLEGRSQRQVAADYGVSTSWVSKLMARYRAEGDAAFTPRSRRPHHSPQAIPEALRARIVGIRHQLTSNGLDAGPDTIAWHLHHHHNVTVSPATIARYLSKAGLVIAEPAKRPKSSYLRFQADMPNETWQSDFTHYPLADGTDTEIITWLDDCTRMALHVSAHHRITATIVTATFHQTIETNGIPASTLTDNGMVYTVRLAAEAHHGGRTSFESELRRMNITQKNSRPNHPTTCGKVERFQQTLKKWLRAQPDQPENLTELQTLINQFVTYYNQHRPHRSLPHRSTPATRYTTLPKAAPSLDRSDDSHNRVRRDIIDKHGKLTLRINGRIHHIGIGRTHARTPVIMLIDDHNARIIDAVTGELLRHLTINPDKDYQPQNDGNS